MPLHRAISAEVNSAGIFPRSEGENAVTRSAQYGCMRRGREEEGVERGGGGGGAGGQKPPL